MRTKQGLTGILAVAGLFLLAPAAKADEFTIEGFGGYYDPNAVDENGEIFGGRIGLRPSDEFGMQLSVGAIDLEDDFLDIEDEDLRYQLLLADFSFQWYPTGSGFYVMAGPGYSTVDIEVDVPGDDNDFEDDDSTWTAHAGLGYRWDIGESFFIRPEAKARYFDGTEFEFDEGESYDGLDTEFTLGLGFRFGGN